VCVSFLPLLQSGAEPLVPLPPKTGNTRYSLQVHHDRLLTCTRRLVAEEEAPSGMLARGHYTATSSFVDDDKKTHLKFEWSFDIAKDW